jgi:hypothetical protein
LLEDSTCNAFVPHLACTACEHTGDVAFHHRPTLATGTGQLDLMRGALTV